MLIQTLMGLAISTIVISTVALMSSHQAQESRALSEKFAAVDTQRVLSAAVSDSSLCTDIMNTSVGGNTFDSTAIGGNPGPQIAIQTLTSSGPSAAPLATVGSPVSNISNSMVVTSIELKNFTFTGTTDKYFADLYVDYDQTRLVRPIHSSTAKLVVATQGPAGAKTITSCAKSAVGAPWVPSISQLNCNWITSCQNNANCPLGQYVAGINTYIPVGGYTPWAVNTCSRIYCCSPN